MWSDYQVFVTTPKKNGKGGYTELQFNAANWPKSRAVSAAQIVELLGAYYAGCGGVEPPTDEEGHIALMTTDTGSVFSVCVHGSKKYIKITGPLTELAHTWARQEMTRLGTKYGVAIIKSSIDIAAPDAVH